MDGPVIRRLSFNTLEGAITFTAGTLGSTVRRHRMLGHEEMGVFHSRAQPLPPGQPTGPCSLLSQEKSSSTQRLPW